MSKPHPLIQQAIEIAGGQQRLAEAIGCAQQHVSKMLRRERAISAEHAVLIDRATAGKIARESLRPDLFNGRAA